MRIQWIALAVLALWTISCETSSGARMISEQQVARDEFGNVWVARLYEQDCDAEDYPHDATLNIRNELDRNITLDFDGPTHYEISIGDKRTATLRMQPGAYGVLLNAPGLKYSPGNFSYSLQEHCVYEMIWERVTSRTEYRE